LFDLAYERDANWQRREQTLAALSTLTQARAVELLRAALAPATQRGRNFLGYARDHRAAAGAPADNVRDPADWKRQRRYR
jgi:hypothetical protein